MMCLLSGLAIRFAQVYKVEAEQERISAYLSSSQTVDDHALLLPQLAQKLAAVLGALRDNTASPFHSSQGPETSNAEDRYVR